MKFLSIWTRVIVQQQQHQLFIRLGKTHAQRALRNDRSLIHKNFSTATATNVGKTTTNSTTDAGIAGAAKEKSKDGGGIPWGLLVPLGLIFGVVGYFYRGNKNQKLETAFRTELRNDLFISPDEMVQLRESNKLSLRMFEDLVRRCRSTLGSNHIQLKQFLDEFCPVQLGGEFQARKSFKSRHILDRLEKSLGDEVDFDLAVLTLSEMVHAEPEELIKSLFHVLNPNETSISFERYAEIVGKLEKTNQLPARVLIKTEKSYPFNRYRRAMTDEIAVNSLRAIHPNPKDKDKDDKFLEERVNKTIDEKDFVNLMLSTELCVWGACWMRK
jgi:hypothetical protein